jgi:Domain of unknown function (DUF4375)
MRRSLNRTEVSKAPHLLWNTFIDLLACEEYEDLTSIQRVAHLAFWYDSEVQNGGHYQYFENQAGKRRHEGIEALIVLSLGCQPAVLRQATQVWDSKDRERPTNGDEFVNNALDAEFAELDSAYNACPPTIIERLESYLTEYQDQFVLVDESA